jgi:ligand-binding sensor domain-containing protein/anti-sigma regulatory factor (Ser/Thr protein kinase)
MIRNGLIVLLFYVLVNPVSAQEHRRVLQLHQLTNKNGLSDLTNEFVYKDKQGFIWSSSLEGLNRYDGRRVKVYKSNPTDSTAIYDDNIQSPFFENDQGDIWFTTVNAIHVYRRNRDNFDRYSVNHKGKQYNTVPYTAFYLEQNRWFWVLAGDSLFRFDTHQNLNQPQDAQFLHTLQAARFAVDTFQNGQVRRLIACYWAYGKGIELIDYDEKRQAIQRETYFTDKKSNILPALTIKKALYVNDSLVWLSAQTGLVAFNPQNPVMSQHYPLSILTKIQNIGLMPNTNMLVSTNQGAFYIFDENKKKYGLLSITSKIGEPINQLMPAGANNLFLDRSKTIWFSVYQKGLFFTTLNQIGFNQVTNINDNYYNTEQILESHKGQIWITHSTNKFVTAKVSAEKKITEQNNLQTKGKICEDESNNLWRVTTDGKIQKLDTRINQFKTIIGVDSLIFSDILSYDKTTLALGTNKGVYYFDTKSKQLSALNEKDYVFNFCKDNRKKWWIGTADGKLLHFIEQNGNKWQLLKQIQNLTLINHFHIASTDTSILWAASVKGIYKINLNTLKDTLLTEKDGLLTNYIQAILEDKHGNLWCSTNQGIFKYNPNTKASKGFTKRQGLSSDAYNRGAALLSSTGEMWFGGNNGVDVFHPDSIQDIGHAPQSAIVGLKIFDKYWKTETAIEVAEHITLKHNENTLTFELAAMEYTDPENNRFKVALVAEDDTIQWTDLGTQNYVTYPNLREGTYTFMLLTANSEGIWNTTPKRLVIEIKPPYWRTWWFLTLIALATIALVAYIVYLRLSKVIALQKIRLNLYENLHDDIGSRLTAIVLSVDMLMQKSVIKDDKLGQIGTVSRNIVANMRRLVWATAPENDALSTVAQQMQTDKRVLLPTGVSFQLTMEKTLENLNIGGDKRYQMLSIFNEALTNIAKYAEATTVETRIEIRAADLIMTITDNGKGYDPTAKRDDSAMSSGHGLRNMQRRANRIKGSLDIASKLGEGTTVKLSFPLKDDTIWSKFTHLFSKSHQNR